MIRDPLYRDILQRLSEPPDPAAFERAVPDLLRPHLGLVIPVPGGDDAGFDAAVVDGEGEPYPAMCTVGADVLGNLRSSLTANLAADFPRRKAVVATTQRLTNQRKRNLFREARKLGFELVGIFDRVPLASLLYHDPKTRLELLDLGGEPPALAAVPAPGRYPIRPTLLARDQDREWIRSVRGDCIVVGVPGSGKTALAADLVEKGGAFFVRQRSGVAAILDACRKQRPRVLVVDDAHVELDLLRELRTARQDTGVRFAILATTWPGQVDEVAETLGVDPRDATRTLELLTRDEILALYRELDVHAPEEYLRDLVDQAANRPGLAVTVAMLWKRGAWEHVVRGKALSAFARHVVRQLVGQNEDVEVLAALALGGARGVSLQAVSDAIGLSVVEVRRIAVALGAAGVIAERGRDALAVEPQQLRSALLAEAYFSGRPTDLDYRRLLSRVESLPAAAEAVVHCLLRGGRLPENEAREIVASVGSAGSWALYANLGPDQARWVLDSFRGKLVEVVRPVLEEAPAPALKRLLGAAYPVPDSLGSTPGYPLRIIQEWIKDFEPTDSLGKLVSRQLAKRALLATAVLEYRAAGGHPEVIGPCLHAVLGPGLWRSSSGVGSVNTFRLTAGFSPAELLEQLPGLWTRLRPCVGTLERPVFSSLSSLLWELIHALVPLGGKVTEAERRAARVLAARLVEDLLPVAAGRPGLSRRLAELAHELGLSVIVQRDPTYDLLFPEEPPDVPDHDSWAAAQREALEQLADQWRELDPTAAAALLAQYRQEAADAGHVWPDNSLMLAQALARRVTSPQTWFAALSAADLAGVLGEPFLAAALEARGSGWEALLDQVLASDDQAGAAVKLALTEANVTEGQRRTAVRRATAFPRLVETLALRNEIPTPVLALLLAEGEPEVALAAAVGHWAADPRGRVDPTLAPAWRDVILRSRGRNSDGTRPNSSLAHGLGQIVARDSGLAFAWLGAEIEAAGGDYFVLLNAEPAWEAAKALAPEQRCRLLAEAPLDRDSDVLVQVLVGEDLDAYRTLLLRQDLAPLHLAPLRGCPERRWWTLAAAALDAGTAPADLAHAAYDLETDGWSGSEAEHWSRWVEAFAAMRDAADQRVAEVARLGEREARRRVAQATRREREEAMRGCG